LQAFKTLTERSKTVNTLYQVETKPMLANLAEPNDFAAAVITVMVTRQGQAFQKASSSNQSLHQATTSSKI
jgi:hypothetical protein